MLWFKVLLTVIFAFNMKHAIEVGAEDEEKTVHAIVAMMIIGVLIYGVWMWT